jgi:hypothetical protein
VRNISGNLGKKRNILASSGNVTLVASHLLTELNQFMISLSAIWKWRAAAPATCCNLPCQSLSAKSTRLYYFVPTIGGSMFQILKQAKHSLLSND